MLLAGSTSETAGGLHVHVRQSVRCQPQASRRRLRCGQHVSEAEHQAAAQLQLQATIESEQSRYEGVVASAVMRAMFPQDAARRAFLKSVGASTAAAAMSQFFPLEDRDRGVRAGRAAREEGSQGRLHSDHLRDADHHGRADGLLRQARPQRRSDQDRRLGGRPRQDHQQGIRRRPHAVADAARDLAWASARIRCPTRCRRWRTSTARRSRWR